ncbi:hypothetical protein [Chitinophaga nivalis]|uniref:Uncharacterized protein n=1 Tax=Chitinophaga nivalis TaxID=2991709 RepID=A0ABT3IF67_9BACT|nr:hypothetical protein [Chitinophaga nivalis]MCW3467699.1 hypothetical protein [Chitinophaga nivalis]MCW3482609.1 hypothetical protein [Chitinophaga nivalis]
MKLLLLTLVWVQTVSAQPLLTPVGSNAGIGAYSRHFQDAITAYRHPAALSGISAFTGGSYAENRFLLRSITLYIAAAAIPVKPGAFGIGITRLGNTDWYQQQLSLSYGRALGNRCGIGLQFSYETTAVTGYGKSGRSAVTIGGLWHIDEKFHVGGQLEKIPGLPVTYIIGAGFEASRNCLLATEVSRQETTGTDVKATAHYRITPALALQLGFAAQPPRHNAGVMVYWHAWRIDMTASFHPQLGITPATTIIWQRSATPAAE